MEKWIERVGKKEFKSLKVCSFWCVWFLKTSHQLEVGIYLRYMYVTWCKFKTHGNYFKNSSGLADTSADKPFAFVSWS